MEGERYLCSEQKLSLWKQNIKKSLQTGLSASWTDAEGRKSVFAISWGATCPMTWKSVRLSHHRYWESRHAQDF